MNSRQFDRLTRILSGSLSRRSALSALGAIVLGRATPARAASQIAIPACGEAGAVCTQIMGCCSGLTCATSYMNPAYGVCVTGSGGMLPVTSSIVTPSSEGIEVELAQEVAAAEAAPATLTDPQAERQVRIDARRAKKSSRRTTRKSNNDTQRTTKISRRDSRRLNEAPHVELQFFQEVPPVMPLDQPENVAETPDPLDTPIAADAEEVDEGKPEIVRIRNLDDVSVVLSRVESIGQPDVFSTLSVTVPAGGTYLLESGQYVPDRAPTNTTIWTKETVCPAGGGVHVVAAQSGSSQTHTFTVHCGEFVSNGVASSGNTRKRKKKKQQQKKRKANRRDTKQKRKQRKK